jgi:hypothetical protein
LLNYLKKYPTYLLTQRKYEIDIIQPLGNSAEKLVLYINNKNQLNIRTKKEYYLNAIDQLQKGKPCAKKIEYLYSQKLRTKHLSNPKQIVLIDDSLIEHAKIEKAKDFFENLNIKIMPVLILNTMYYSENNMQIIKKYIPSFFNSLSELSRQEQNKLQIAMNLIKNRQNSCFTTNRNLLFCSALSSVITELHDNNKTYQQTEEKKFIHKINL